MDLIEATMLSLQNKLQENKKFHENKRKKFENAKDIVNKIKETNTSAYFGHKLVPINYYHK